MVVSKKKVKKVSVGIIILLIFVSLSGLFLLNNESTNEGGVVLKLQQIDSDQDGLYDDDEIYNWGTNPNETDTDDDGLDDYEEVNDPYNTNPRDSDTDGDGLEDGEEAHKYQTDPKSYDTDHDGYSDGEEIRRGTNPNDGSSRPSGDEGMPFTAFLLNIVVLVGLNILVFLLMRRKARKAREGGEAPEEEEEDELDQWFKD